MMRSLVLVFLLLAAPALAQQQGLPQYSLTVTAQELTTLGAALGARPYNEVAGLIGKLQQQAIAQETAASRARAAAEAKEPAKDTPAQ